jgi:NADH:ubiquinone oxidoreductase subunit 5 (subunit L)/multisubunit Na+/H+ antiporter MnhA subunit
MAAVAFLLQVATFGYCIRIYLSSAWQQRNDPSTRSASVIGSSKTRTARASARRVREVLVLQWRSLAIVAIAIFTIAFVCTVFIVYDNNNTLAGLQNVDDRLIPWVICIIQTQDKTKCLAQASKINVDQDLAVATLFIIGIIGIEAFILLSRPEMFLAWWELLRRAGKTRRSGSTTSELLMRTIPKNYQQQPERMSGSLDKAVDYDGIPSGFRGEAESESKQYPVCVSTTCVETLICPC